MTRSRPDRPTVEDYVRFLPPERRALARRPTTSEHRTWQDHRVRLLRHRDAAAPARVLLVHGAGGYSEALWPVAAQSLEAGLDLCAVDLPLYGDTRSPDRGAVRYDDWVRLLQDLVSAEDDGRPLLLLGASMGGMLALEAAVGAPSVAGVLVTCLLDPADAATRAHLTRLGPLAVPGRALSAVPLPPLLDRLPVPIAQVAPLARMSRDPALGALCARDPRGGGGRVPLGFLRSFLRYHHRGPERVRVPVVLAHPARDSWTPPELSERVLARVAGTTRSVRLDGCGHYPVEEPGLTALVAEIGRLAGIAVSGVD